MLHHVTGRGGGGGGKGGGKGGSRSGSAPSATEAENTHRSNQVARVVDLLCEGQGVQLVNGAKSIFLNDTPLQNPDGTFNFAGVNVQFRSGEASQDPILDFPSSESEVGVGTEVKAPIPITRQVSDPDTDAVRIRLRFPALWVQDKTNGNMDGTSVHMQVWFQSYGGSWTLLKDVIIHGKWTAPYEEQHTFPVTGSPPWNFRVYRVTPDTEDSAIQNRSYWATYTQITYAKLSYPNSALVALRASAQEFGDSVPSRAYEIYGKWCRVPVNYDPIARTYTGIWNGAFKWAYTNNSAWILFDILTGIPYGGGMYGIRDEHIYLPDFYTAAQYCDENVPNGYGGVEPRFTFNGVLSTQEPILKVLDAVCSSMEAMIYLSSGMIMLTQDRPKDATKLVTPANTIEGNIDFPSSALSSRHSIAKVSYNDPNDNYELEPVFHTDYDALNVTKTPKSLDVVAIGCTSRGQAFRKARTLLENEANSTQLVGYRCSLDQADVRPGDVVNVSSPSLSVVSWGGRLKSFSASELVLDRQIKFIGGSVYSITLVMSDGSLQQRTITNAGADTDTIQVSEAFTGSAIVGAVWAVQSNSTVFKPFRVVSVKEVEKHIFEVVGVLYDPTKYSRIEHPSLKIEKPNYTNIPRGALLGVRGVGHNEFLSVDANGNVIACVNISWEASPDPRAFYYEVEVKGTPQNGEYWERVGDTSSGSIELKNVVSGSYYIRVRATDAFRSLRSEWFTAGAYELEGLLAPPANVTGFAVNVLDANAHLTWNKVQDLDLSHYEIRYSVETDGSATWETSSVLANNVQGEQVFVPARKGTYLIKAIDTSDVESTGAAFIISKVDKSLWTNLVSTLVEHPAFAGEREQIEFYEPSIGIILRGANNLDDVVDLDALVDFDYLDGGVVSEGFYYFENDYDLGQSYLSRITVSLKAFGHRLHENMDQWLNMDDVENVDEGADSALWDVQLEVRHTDDDPEASPVWSPWTTFIVGDYQARAFEFRVRLSSWSPSVSPVVYELKVTIDMPDRRVGERDRECSADGDVIVFDPPYKNLKAVNVLGQDLSSGDYMRVTNKNEGGFEIRFYNSAGVGKVATYDYEAVGY